MLVRTIPPALGFIVAVTFAVWFAAFLEVDSCLDAGGVIREPGFCDVAGGPYVPVFGRPGLYMLWATFLAVTLGVGWSVKRALVLLLQRHP